MSNTVKRILSAVLALPIYAFTIVTDIFQSVPILINSLLVSLICLYEFYQITDKGDNGKVFLKVGIVTGFIVNIIMYLFAFGKVYGYSRYIESFNAKVIMGILLILIVVIAIIQIFTRPLKGATYSMAVTVFGVIFIVFSFSHIILMKALNNGVYYIIMLNAVIMVNDSGAYFGGTFLGRHKAQIPASPNKSWEGYFCGLLCSILTILITNQIYIFYFNVELFSMIEAAVIGILLSLLGNIGDLIESVIKRDGDIKDSGSIIPGHGGMWDVFDALIFTYPIFYYYLIIRGV